MRAAWDVLWKQWPAWAWPLAVAVAVWTSIVTHLDPSGSYPQSGAGPGITIDESFNVQQGVILVEALRTYGPIGLTNLDVLKQVFTPPLHLPDHPPLGRFWLGVHHELWRWLFPPSEPGGRFVTACARSGSATAFALTVFLVGYAVSVWYGQLGGLLAALGLGLLPRVYGHAHLAALETVTNLFITLSVLCIAISWPGERAPSTRTALWTGAVFGLALLCKMQAALLPPALVLWAWFQWRRQAVRPVILFGVASFIVFFVGWPWLWFDPWHHLISYFRQSSERLPISVWWGWSEMTDKTVPRQYAFVYLVSVTPIKYLIAGVTGFARSSRIPEGAGKEGAPPAPAWTSRETWLLFAMATYLIVFSLPGVPVYDCERLFLPLFPLLCLFVGRGAQWLYWRVQVAWPSGAWIKQGLMLALGFWGIFALPKIAPCYLAYYPGTYGGVAAGESRGFELDYWASAITRGLQQRIVETVPPGTTIGVAPVLHQFQVEELLTQSPILRRHQIQLVPFDPERTPVDFVLLYRRQASLSPALQTLLAESTPLAAEERMGVVLAGLYRWPLSKPE